MPAAELRIVDQLAGVLGQQPHEFRKLGQLLNVGDVAQIARQDRREIGSQPILPPSLIVAADRLRKPAEQDELDQIVADDRVPLALGLSFEEALEEGRRPAFDLGLCQRQHLDGLHPSGQAVGDPRQGQHVRRSGEQESPRPIVLVDRLLDRQQQVGGALDFVDDGSVQAPDEAGRIGLSRLREVNDPLIGIVRIAIWTSWRGSASDRQDVSLAS